jgi:hypothetical protein
MFLIESKKEGKNGIGEVFFVAPAPALLLHIPMLCLLLRWLLLLLLLAAAASLEKDLLRSSAVRRLCPPPSRLSGSAPV